jgi:hypothetical protein
LGASPALFVENAGQWTDRSIRFMHQGDGANVAITDAGPVFQVFREAANCAELTAPEMARTQSLQFSAFFVGANRTTPIGREPAEAQFNYFVGDRSSWRTAAPSYSVVTYENLYSGIELRTWGQRDSLKYEFHVAPCADYRQIQVRYTGIGGLSIAEDGSLHINLGDGWDELVDDAPCVYQVIDGRQIAVAARFELIDSRSYTFAVTGQYDVVRELVVDPDLAWASYLGGSGGDYGYGVSVDASGDSFVTGYSASANFAGANNNSAGGNTDAFVAKVSSQGTLLWATYLGGSADDYSYGIAVDQSGDAYITGNTNSPSFAGANNEYHGGAYDAFVAKISTAGSLGWATFLGGGGYDYGYGIAVDAAGDAFLAGQTTSTNFAAANNAYKGGTYDAFAAKVTAAGTIAWATYLGGSANDVGRGIAVDDAENVFVTGNTASTNFSGRNNTFQGGDMDAFALKISLGTLAWATYLGGSGNDFGYGVAIDASNNIFITGSTASTNFSGANNVSQGGIDAFAAKIGGGGTITWATFLGGSKDDIGYGIAVSSASSIFVSGNTASVNFSGANNAYHGGTYDAFATKLYPQGNSAWATYLGGGYDDTARGVRVNSAGVIFVSGQTTSANFSGSNNSAKGSIDAFAARIDERPGIPDLVSSSDTGKTDTDDITNLDNSSTGKTLEFLVRGTAAEGTVTIYADGIAIGSATAQGSATTVATIGTFDLVDGAHVITARQTEPGQPESVASDGLTMTVDTTPPAVSVEKAAGQRDPTADSPIRFTVRFSEPVIDFAANDITLSGTAATAKAAISGSGTTYDVVVSGMTSSGTVIAALLATAAHDIAGNASVESTSTDNVVLYNVATRVWNGGGSDGNWATAENWAGRLAPSNGDNLVFPADAGQFEVIDDLPADARFSSVVVAGGDYRFGNPLMNSSIVKVLSGAALNIASLVCDTLTIGAKMPGMTKTWSGKGVDNHWTTPANWVGGVAPSCGDALVFPAGAVQPVSFVDLPPEMSLDSITASAVKLEGEAKLTVTSITCDTLTIGSASAAANVATVATSVAIDVPRSVGVDFPTQTAVEQTVPVVVGMHIPGSRVTQRLPTQTKNEAAVAWSISSTPILKNLVLAPLPRRSSFARVAVAEYSQGAPLDGWPDCSHIPSRNRNAGMTSRIAVGPLRFTVSATAAAQRVLDDASGTDWRNGPAQEELIDVLANALVNSRSNVVPCRFRFLQAVSKW